MAYNFSAFKQTVTELEERLRREMSTIRTGRATPAILDGVKVEAYGSAMPINQVASVSVEDARMIRVSPWDASQAKAIEKAIVEADLGLSVTIDGSGVRVIFPELTSDRRAGLLKIAKQKLEEVRVAMRGEREKVIKDLDKQEKDGTISKDDHFRLKGDLQKIVDEAGSKFEEMLEKKEKEISE